MKMNKLMVYGLVFAVMACKTSSLVQAQQAPQPDKTFTLKVTEQELNVISEGLQSQPFKIVFPLMQKLQAQILEQNKPAIVENKPVDKVPEGKQE